MSAAERPVHSVHVDEIRIPLSDGVRLSARLWRPADEPGPVPTVMEYIPYGKSHMTAVRDETMHAVFAAAGYAALRVDLRGSADSDGDMQDEYAPQELDDAEDVLAWIAEQPWSDGGVGIMGKSWGGFNGLQIAARRPPQLRAVITVCSTDDRYRDDVHYHGGSIIGSEMLSWASTMFAYNARPPTPMTGDRWREQWLRRVTGTAPYVTTWLSHQRRDDYWKHGSVCEDFSAIDVPVLAIGGVHDQYRTTIFRLLENLSSPVKGILGPWAHLYPHQGVPGPTADFVGEALRWWDAWLRGIDNGAQSIPDLRVFVPKSAPVGSDRSERPGRWLAIPDWSDSGIRPSEQSFVEAELSGPVAQRSDLAFGGEAGEWLQFGDPAAQPADQQSIDAMSRCATFPPLTQDRTIIGEPRVRIRVRSDVPTGQLAVRLCDVAPDGQSRLVTAGLVNLTHRNGHEHPEALHAGEDVEVDVDLLAVAHRFAAGHRIRIGVSASLWPWLWPVADNATIGVPLNYGVLELPGADEAGVPANDPLLQPVEASPAPNATGSLLRTSSTPTTRTISRELGTGAYTVELRMASRQNDLGSGLQWSTSQSDVYTMTAGDPLSATAECRRT
ncbi:MAG: CocE/NonD family hydrolase, partial [Brachybacterium sp.]|nr:CocE/NonD family hydrolase [Brachybacterium sp.]